LDLLDIVIHEKTWEGVMAPVIDVHTHLFSALDIPLEGYLVSRRIEKKRPFELEYLINFLGPHIFNYLADRMRDRSVTRQLGGGKKGVYYSWLLNCFGSYMGQDLKTWEEALTETIRNNAKDLSTVWENVDLFVPLIVDYEYWFKNSVDVPMDHQIDTMYNEVILKQQGKFHAFVPFDPARELAFQKGLNNPDGQKEDKGSWKPMKDAIEKKGFIGVKVYNSLGYRPLGNGEDNAPLYHQRVAVRNDKIPYLFDGPSYDQVMRKLYAFCEENGVPITAHCMMNGIEAYPMASEHFGAAKLWEPVLKDYKKLRLNLAHFGWNPVGGYGYGHQKNWMKEICGMMRVHENLYADVGHLDVVTRLSRPDFINAFKSIQRDFSGDIGHIKKRVLYGSDWHVLQRVKNYRSFMKRFIDVMKTTGFYSDDGMDDFLGGNAMQFLGLLPGGKNRIRLEAFYKKNGIAHPKWFEESA
jgi:hypothetical protein